LVVDDEAYAAAGWAGLDVLEEPPVWLVRDGDVVRDHVWPVLPHQRLEIHLPIPKGSGEGGDDETRLFEDDAEHVGRVGANRPAKMIRRRLREHRFTAW
jgi:hypothetical protein